MDRVENSWNSVSIAIHLLLNGKEVKKKWKRSSTSVKMEIKNILAWYVQRHVEKEWSQGEGIRLHLQKTELISWPIEYCIYHIGSDSETFENRRSLHI